MSKQAIQQKKIGKNRRVRGILLLLLAFSLGASGIAQDSNSNTAALIVTLRETQVGGKSPAGAYSTCINVWEDGRFHLERRWQQLPSATATLQVLESVLPESQLQQLRSILEGEAIRELPPFQPLDTSTARTWVRSFRADIPRGTTVQTVGYFEWGSYNPSAREESERDVVTKPAPTIETALNPLSEWLHHVSSAKLPISTAKPTMCGEASN